MTKVWERRSYAFPPHHTPTHCRKQRTCTLQLLLRASVKAEFLHRTVVIEDPLKVEYPHITVAVGRPFESTVLIHYSCFDGPLNAGYLLLICFGGYYMSG